MTTFQKTPENVFFDEVKEKLRPYLLPVELVLKHYLEESGLIYSGSVSGATEGRSYIWIEFSRDRAKTRRTNLLREDLDACLQLFQKVLVHFPDLEMGSFRKEMSGGLTRWAIYTLKPKGVEVPEEVKREMDAKNANPRQMNRRQVISRRLNQLRHDRPDLILAADWLEDVEEAAQLIEIPFNELKAHLKIK